MDCSFARLRSLFLGLAAVPLLLGAALVEAGCHDCHDGSSTDVSGASLDAAGGVTDADRVPGSPGDLETVLTDAACQRICPPDPGGRTLGQCVEIFTDASAEWCGPSSPEWDPSTPVPAGCLHTVECDYDYAMCVTSPG
jgi:hypothetical protein